MTKNRIKIKRLLGSAFDPRLGSSQQETFSPALLSGRGSKYCPHPWFSQVFMIISGVPIERRGITSCPKRNAKKMFVAIESA